MPANDDRSTMDDMAAELEATAENIAAIAGCIRELDDPLVARSYYDGLFEILADKALKARERRELEWLVFVSNHPELGLSFTSKELLDAVRKAGNGASSRKIAQCLRPWPSRGDVGRVVHGLSGLSIAGKVEHERCGRYATWRMA
jgi:hypothetical protein